MNVLRGFVGFIDLSVVDFFVSYPPSCFGVILDLFILKNHEDKVNAFQILTSAKTPKDMICSK